ncbi:MAG: hypothetical protein AAB131_21710, partial [Actinomycetota bacterium]
WAGVLGGLKNIAVESKFDTTLKGPLTALDTNLQLTGTGGTVTGQLTLDTTVPGWHGAGAVNVAQLNLARWMNRDDRLSNITGHVTFNLDLDLGRRFPHGTYTFQGPHAAFMGYEGDNINARGHITTADVVIERANVVAYGATVAVEAGSIGLDGPFPFRFQGTTAALDLRRVPVAIPVPRVESVLALRYDVSGRFTNPFIIGRAEFGASEFLGATIGAGTVGTLDTSAKPLRYGGNGTIAGVDLNRFGRGLDIAWMRDPRYAGTVSGRFHVQGAGTDRASLELNAGGQIDRAQLFRGEVSDADVSLEIARGTLTTTFIGGFSTIDPAVALANPRLAASLTGSANVLTTVRDLLVRTPALADYTVSGGMELQESTIGQVAIEAGVFEGALQQEELSLRRVEVAGPNVQGRGAGTLAFNDAGVTNFDYDIAR